MSGYTACACRDCFEIAIGEAGEALCNLCEEAECEAGTEAECCGEHSYGGSDEDEERVISKRGDVNAADHGGGAIVHNEHGYHLEWTHGLMSEHPEEEGFDDEIADLKLNLFRVPLDESAWAKLSTCGDEDKLWTGIASSNGMDLAEVIELAKSEKPVDIATALEMFAGHWGWENLDSYPVLVRYADLSERWES